MSIYKHGELEQTSVNLQTWRISTDECQPSVSLQTWRIRTDECQPTNMEKYNKRVSAYKHVEVQQKIVSLQTTYNVIPLDSCVHTVRLLQPQCLYLPPQSLRVVEETSLMARVRQLKPNRSDET